MSGNGEIAFEEARPSKKGEVTVAGEKVKVSLVRGEQEVSVIHL